MLFWISVQKISRWKTTIDAKEIFVSSVQWPELSLLILVWELIFEKSGGVLQTKI